MHGTLGTSRRNFITGFFFMWHITRVLICYKTSIPKVAGWIADLFLKKIQLYREINSWIHQCSFYIIAEIKKTCEFNWGWIILSFIYHIMFLVLLSRAINDRNWLLSQQIVIFSDREMFIRYAVIGLKHVKKNRTTQDEFI